MPFDLEDLLLEIPGGTRNARMTPSERPSAPSRTEETRAGTPPATHPQGPAKCEAEHHLRVRAVDMRVLNPHDPHAVQDGENATSEPPLRVLRVGGTLSPRRDPQGGEGQPAPPRKPRYSREELIAINRRAWELVEVLRRRDWERAGEYGKRLNRSPWEEWPNILVELMREVGDG